MTTTANNAPEDAGITWSIRVGDVLGRLRELPEESVQCVVTSPPYWGLRDYGTATWDGGEAGCDHVAPAMGGTGKETLVGTTAAANGTWKQQFRTVCGKCGARRIDAQLGLEPTPEEYVAKMAAVFAGVRRVLRDDGTLWLNIGDSYNAGRNGGWAGGKGALNEGRDLDAIYQGRSGPNVPGLKPKDLVGIPWRLAFALQTDGWYLRSDIIWSKPNPMPESVTDRPTKAHEYLFLLTKSARYYFDQGAVREPAEYGFRTWSNGRAEYDYLGAERTKHTVTGGDPSAGRNIRSVWTIATQPFPEAHFATFPEALVEPCIKAGSRQDDTILDPFAGSGTTGVVALKLGRSFIGIELNQTYAEMARRRVGNTAPSLAQEIA